MNFKLLLASLLITSCAIVSYYDTKKIRPQIQKLQKQTSATMTLIEQDYARKVRVIEASNAQGVNLAMAPYSEITTSFAKLGDQRKDLMERSGKLQGMADGILAHIGTKKKIDSTDPRFQEIEKFRGMSEDELDDINEGLKDYQKESNHFNDLVNKHGFRWVNVNQFKQQLMGVVGLLKLQCDTLDEKLEKAGVQARSTKDRDDVQSMRGDVKELRGVQGELKDFLAKFEKTTAGQTDYVITPKHPQAELFNSLGPIQDRAEKIIDSFNAKAKTYQKN